jgi:GDP-fucose transporter C1
VLPFTVFFSWWLLRTKSSPPTLLAVGVVCIGFFAGVSAEKVGGTSMIGVILGVASSVTTAVHAIVVKRSLNIVSGTMDLAYFSNLLSAFVILPFIFLSGEIFTIFDMMFGDGPGFWTFIVGATITGFFGFLICIAGFLSIKVTSPISHMVSAAVRGVLQTFLGIWCFGDEVGSGRAVGIVFILSGSVYYVYTKSQEQNQPQGQQQPASDSSSGGLPQSQSRHNSIMSQRNGSMTTPIMPSTPQIHMQPGGPHHNEPIKERKF